MIKKYIKIWKEYFKDLLIEWKQEDTTEEQMIEEDQLEKSFKKEIKEILNRSKSKAPGKDGIKPDLIKYGSKGN